MPVFPGYKRFEYDCYSGLKKVKQHISFQRKTNENFQINTSP